MKVRRNSKKHLNALVNGNITLPKDFPWKVFGALLKDLRCLNVEVDADHDDFSSEPWALFASKILRSRSAETIGTLGSLLGPPSMLPELVGEKKEALSFFTRYQVGSFLKNTLLMGQLLARMLFEPLSGLRHSALALIKKIIKRCSG